MRNAIVYHENGAVNIGYHRSCKHEVCVRFEVITAVTKKNVVPEHGILYKNPVRTSQGTRLCYRAQAVDVMTDLRLSRRHYEECRLLGCVAMWFL
jgi:hypothetical protein